MPGGPGGQRWGAPDSFSGGPGQGGPGGPGGRGGQGWGARGPGPQSFGQNGEVGDGKQECTYNVPANKCGIIIGKGGETIRQINMQSGAYCELAKAPPPNPNEKVFVIKGTLDQIQEAKKLINEKIGLPPPPMGGVNAIGESPQPGGGFPQQAQPQGGPGFGFPAQNQPNSYQWQNQTQPAAEPQPSTGMLPTNPLTGQPDYSAQWAEYYRNLGMFKEADIIEQQAKATRVAAASVGGLQPGVSQPAAAAGHPGQMAGAVAAAQPAQAVQAAPQP